jgi:predicted transcriptional regulator
MGAPKAATRTLTAHVPRDLAEEVDILATQLERPRGWIVKQALTLFVDREREKERLTREGLAAVDAGRVVPHADVKAWAKSLGTAKPLRVPRAR